jgi:hypothetical protein
MEPRELINTGALLLVLGSVAPANAQQEQDVPVASQRPRPTPPPGGAPAATSSPAAPAPREVRLAPTSVAGAPVRPQQHGPQQPLAGLPPTSRGQLGHAGDHDAIWQGHRARNWISEHRTWQDRGGYSGPRIPDSLHAEAFGPDHSFRIEQFPVMVVGGRPRFQYGGFWFSVVDPWPEYWAEDWYAQDDVYIDALAGGYYLFNRRHPTDRVAVSVQRSEVSSSR